LILRKKVAQDLKSPRKERTGRRERRGGRGFSYLIVGNPQGECLNCIAFPLSSD